MMKTKVYKDIIFTDPTNLVYNPHFKVAPKPIKYKTSDVLLFGRDSFTQEQAFEVSKRMKKIGLILDNVKDFSSISRKDAIHILKQIINAPK